MSLHGHDDVPGQCQGIDGQQAEAGRAVDQDVIVLPFAVLRQRSELVFEHALLQAELKNLKHGSDGKLLEDLKRKNQELEDSLRHMIRKDLEERNG